MELVIAEKPSVARSIAGVLGAAEKRDGYLQGGGYVVTWCIGHLVSMCEAGNYDERFKKWRYEDLPILPQDWKYTVPAEKKKQFDVIRELMQRPDVNALICATDAGREGELIFRFVYLMTGCTKPFSRLWISSMEADAIREGFRHLKPGGEYDALYQSAICRAKADWLVGINATRLFSVLYHKTLNVGRVQTPALNMLVERGDKISTFQKERYYIVHIGAGGAEAASERISDAAHADDLKTACEASRAVCVSVKREKKTEQPPKLYDLTTLQREANRLYGFTDLSANRQPLSHRRYGTDGGGSCRRAFAPTAVHRGRGADAGDRAGTEQRKGVRPSRSYSHSRVYENWLCRVCRERKETYVSCLLQAVVCRRRAPCL